MMAVGFFLWPLSATAPSGTYQVRVTSAISSTNSDTSNAYGFIVAGLVSYDITLGTSGYDGSGAGCAGVQVVVRGAWSDAIAATGGGVTTAVLPGPFVANQLRTVATAMLPDVGVVDELELSMPTGTAAATCWWEGNVALVATAAATGAIGGRVATFGTAGSRIDISTGAMARPNCFLFDACGDCAAQSGCGWCPSTRTCSPDSGSGPGSHPLTGFCPVVEPAGSTTGVTLGWTADPATCPDPCSELVGCQECIFAAGEDVSCGWCDQTCSCRK